MLDVASAVVVHFSRACQNRRACTMYVCRCAKAQLRSTLPTQNATRNLNAENFPIQGVQFISERHKSRTLSPSIASLKHRVMRTAGTTQKSAIPCPHQPTLGRTETLVRPFHGCETQASSKRRSWLWSIRRDGWMGRVRRRGKRGFSNSQGGAKGGMLYNPLAFPDVTKIVRSLTPRERKLWAAGFVCLLAAVSWLRNLAAAGLVDDTEPLFAEAARQMLVTGDYITPQFNAQPRFDKPILIYWLMALSGKVFGPSVWALRLPSALCGLGLLVALLITVKQFGLTTPSNVQSHSEEPGSSSAMGLHYVPAVITAAAFALNLEVVAWGSTALSDMLLTSTLGATLLSFFWGYAGYKLNPPKHGWGYPLSAVFMGLACLSKGPVGIVFPVLVCTCFLLCTGEFTKVLMKEIPYLKGILALLLINLPWYGAMASKHGLVYLSTFFGYHNLERFLQGVNHHAGRPWWYGLAVVIVMYFPWSLSLTPALLQAHPWRQPWRMAERWQTLPLFAAAWLFAGFALFALSSSQLPSYYLPVAPAIAMLAAVHLSKDAKHEKDGVFSGFAPACFYLLLAGLLWFSPALLQASGDATAVQIGQILGEKHLHEFAFVSLGVGGMLATRTSEFKSAYGPQLQPGDARLGTDAQKVGMTFLPMWVLHTTVMVLFLGIFLTPVYKVVDGVRQAPLRELAYTAAKLQEAGEPLVMVGTRMPSVVYYSKLPTAFFDSPREAVTVIQEQAAPGVASALIITESELDQFPLSPSILATSGEYKLIRVHRRPPPTPTVKQVGSL